MSQFDEDENILSETEAGQDEIGGSSKLVPVTESIRYRKRAQSAERRSEQLAEQLNQAKQQITEMSEQVNSLQFEQRLGGKLVSAGAVDIEAAMLLAKAKIEEDLQADMDGVIEQLKKDKQYLFADKANGYMASSKTAGAKDRLGDVPNAVSAAAKKAAATGNRTDLQKYLRLRRSFG
jgi:hypothetical protein